MYHLRYYKSYWVNCVWNCVYSFIWYIQRQTANTKTWIKGGKKLVDIYILFPCNLLIITIFGKNFLFRFHCYWKTCLFQTCLTTVKNIPVAIPSYGSPFVWCKMKKNFYFYQYLLFCCLIYSYQIDKHNLIIYLSCYFEMT